MGELTDVKHERNERNERVNTKLNITQRMKVYKIKINIITFVNQHRNISYILISSILIIIHNYNTYQPIQTIISYYTEIIIPI